MARTGYDLHTATNQKRKIIMNEVTFFVPASWSKKRRKAAMEEPWYSGRPDGDNILKCILDGLTGTAYADDSAVVHAEITKHRTLDPDEVGCLITVREMAAC